MSQGVFLAMLQPFRLRLPLRNSSRIRAPSLTRVTHGSSGTPRPSTSHLPHVALSTYSARRYLSSISAVHRRATAATADPRSSTHAPSCTLRSRTLGCAHLRLPPASAHRRDSPLPPLHSHLCVGALGSDHTPSLDRVAAKRMNDSKHKPPDDSGGSSPSGHDGVNHQVCQPPPHTRADSHRRADGLRLIASTPG